MDELLELRMRNIRIVGRHKELGERRALDMIGCQPGKLLRPFEECLLPEHATIIGPARQNGVAKRICACARSSSCSRR